jgi:hypothetical protein
VVPSTAGFLEEDFEIEEEAGRTYRMDHEAKRILGYVDGLEAVRQAAFKILSTERYQYIIYSWDYGIETLDLYGEPVSYVCPELERRITDALTQDSRITEVVDFEFETTEKGKLCAAFTVNTVYGALQMEKEVDF